jgi:hypothetical protein
MAITLWRERRPFEGLTRWFDDIDTWFDTGFFTDMPEKYGGLRLTLKRRMGSI